MSKILSTILYKILYAVHIFKWRKARSEILILGLLFFMLFGCSNLNVKSVIALNVVGITNIDKDDSDRSIKLPDDNWEDETPKIDINSEVEKPVEPYVESLKGEKIDFSFIDKLDSKKYSWWISKNKTHDTPEIPSTAKAMISKYNAVYTGDTTKKVIYLTFDEGYENGYTPEILDSLKANNVKALFFITGTFIKTQPNLVKRMLDEGHQVGDHTVSHLSLPDLSDSILEKELLGLEKAYTALTGRTFKYMRPPGGEYSDKVLEAANELGYKTVFWSFAYRDFDTDKQKGADNAYKVVMGNLHNGAVLLLHAISKDNADALDMIIKDIKAQGYEIKPFDL
jgi:peptidoglycan-N-acetylmuramic acid deacetylase